MSAATVHYLPGARADEDEDQDHAADVAALVAEVGQLATRLIEVEQERDQLRVLVVEQAGADEIMIGLCREMCAGTWQARYEQGWAAGYVRAVEEYKAAQHAAVVSAGLIARHFGRAEAESVSPCELAAIHFAALWDLPPVNQDGGA